MDSKLGKNYLGIVDYIVVVATLLFSLLIGIYYGVKGRKSSNNEELLTGSRQMGAIPVAASMLVSYLSAITILGYPAEVYSYGSQVFLLSLMGPITTAIAICLFVEVMYDLKLTSAYKYLEYRYDSIVVRWMGSLIFIIQLLLISGIVMYAPALALETMMGLPLWMSVIGIAIIGTIYTSIGGIKAVVWTDVFQFVMIFVGMAAIVIKAFSNSGGISAAWEIAGERKRLELFNWTFDPFMRHNTLNILVGNGIAGLFFVVHQPVVQRYCSLPTFRDAVKSLLWSYIFGFFTIGLVILTGITIFAAYADCDPLTSGQISKSDQIVPFFVIKELAFIPGMMGLFAAVVFSAVLRYKNHLKSKKNKKINDNF
ncbi:unnamed protein product [Orchesella dallaii]|uniref:Sodium-coupled monocarboxylate transporter 1 n=1 Tax=Orchesella dallaii TaxID=48710 RepID=A0ABP1QVR4_9HEXA